MSRNIKYITDLDIIASRAEDKEDENFSFRSWLKMKNSAELDELVHEINKEVSEHIDCTACGNCCKKLVINVTKEEVGQLAGHLNISTEDAKNKYIEESQEGNCFINTMPCHFLSDNKCTIYESRFAECRDFPHLHKPGFQGRLLGTLMHYGGCPIVYNVLEELKDRLRFRY